jgi:hypothetical protein
MYLLMLSTKLIYLTRIDIFDEIVNIIDGICAFDEIINSINILNRNDAFTKIIKASIYLIGMMHLLRSSKH